MTRFSNTWFNTKPYFFNTKTLKVSRCINDCIDFDNFEWDYAGLCDYLDLGFVSFGNTPVTNVKFLQGNERLEIKDNQIVVYQNEELPVDDSLSSPEEVEYLILQYLKNNIATDDKILLPLSGGYDSRYLAAILKENFTNLISAFTFGNTFRQSVSNEVRFAREVSKRLNIDHKQIHLKNNFEYAEDWDELFGISAHHHGTHQMRFYSSIKNMSNSLNVVISGVGGDYWAGKVKIPEIKEPSDLIKHGYTHGLHANSKYALNQDFSYREKYFIKNELSFENPDFRLIDITRNKMMLIRYLEVIPEFYGYKMVSPFIDEKIAKRMLKLPADIKENRKWQVDYFKSKNIFVDDCVTKNKRRSYIHERLYVQQNKPYLRPELFKEIYDIKRIEYINKHIGNGYLSKIEILLSVPFRGRSLILPFLPKYNFKEVFCEYITLLPLQYLMERRNQYFHNRLHH